MATWRVVDTKLSESSAIESMPCSPRTQPFSAIAASARSASSGVRQNGTMAMTCSPSAHENLEHADAGQGPALLRSMAPAAASIRGVRGSACRRLIPAGQGGFEDPQRELGQNEAMNTSSLPTADRTDTPSAHALDWALRFVRRNTG